MSFQAYLDNIKVKTGKNPEDFKKLASKKGLLKEGVKAGEVVAWLKKEYGLGHGHAMAIYTYFKGTKNKTETVDESVAKFFAGDKVKWKPVFESLFKTLQKLGDDISILPASKYLSILRGKRKIGMVQCTATRMDIGIKLKGVKPTKRFESASGWNPMMTHRVQIEHVRQLDKEIFNWLQSAYEQNA